MEISLAFICLQSHICDQIMLCKRLLYLCHSIKYKLSRAFRFSIGADINVAIFVI